MLRVGLLRISGSSFLHGVFVFREIQKFFRGYRVLSTNYSGVHLISRLSRRLVGNSCLRWLAFMVFACLGSMGFPVVCGPVRSGTASLFDACNSFEFLFLITACLKIRSLRPGQRGCVIACSLSNNCDLASRSVPACSLRPGHPKLPLWLGRFKTLGNFPLQPQNHALDHLAWT